MHQERENIINFLLQTCDQKNRTIEELQKKLAEQQKIIDGKKPEVLPPVPVSIAEN